MTTYTHEGVVFHLDSVYLDVTGVEWAWTGGWSPAGEPLMRSHTDSDRPDCSTPVTLPDVYLWHGPLHRIAPRPTTAECRAAVDVDPNYAASVAAGFVESREAFSARIAPAPVVPIPEARVPLAAGRSFTTPLEHRGFRAFLNTLKRGG